MTCIQVFHAGLHFFSLSPLDHPEFDAQVPAEDPHREGGREQRLRLQEHGLLHSRLPRDGLHCGHVLPEPQGESCIWGRRRRGEEEEEGRRRGGGVVLDVSIFFSFFFFFFFFCMQCGAFKFTAHFIRLFLFFFNKRGEEGQERKYTEEMQTEESQGKPKQRHKRSVETFAHGGNERRGFLCEGLSKSPVTVSRKSLDITSRH